MNLIDTLRARAAGLVARQTELATLAAGEAREMTEVELTEFNEATAEIDRITNSIDRLRDVQTRAAAVNASAAGATAATALATAPVARAAEPAVIRAVTSPGGETVRAAVTQRELTGVETVGLCAWAAAKAKHFQTKTALTHLEEAGFQRIADQCRQTTAGLAQVRALTSLGGGGGDNVIDTPLSTDFIEFLYQQSAFMSGGPVEFDMSEGAIEIPGGNASATGTYGAEGAAIGYSQATTRKVEMSAKHLRSITAMSNYLISRSPLAVVKIFGDDLAMGITMAMDAAGLRGDGAGANPAGLLTLINAAHQFTAVSAAAPTLAQVDFEAKKALRLLDASLVPKRRRRWIMGSRSFRYLQFMRDGNSNLAFPGLSLPNPVWYDNIPVTISDQVPSNLGGATDESEIYLVDFGHVLVGVARSLRITPSNEASYHNAGGTLVSSFDLDETILRGVMSHDFDMRHDKAGVVIEGVKWGS